MSTRLYGFITYSCMPNALLCRVFIYHLVWQIVETFKRADISNVLMVQMQIRLVRLSTVLKCEMACNTFYIFRLHYVDFSETQINTYCRQTIHSANREKATMASSIHTVHQMLTSCYVYTAAESTEKWFKQKLLLTNCYATYFIKAMWMSTLYNSSKVTLSEDMTR